MTKISLPSFVVAFLSISLGLADQTCAQGAPERPYRYVSLDAALPPGFDIFDPVSITDSGRVYGTLSGFDPETFSSFMAVAVYDRGKITVLHEGFANTANNRGTVGGSVLLDPDLFTFQAALFTRREIELIPPLIDEVTAEVRLLSDSGIAFVESFSHFDVSYYLTRRGHVTPLDFGPDQADQFDLNDRGLVSGTSFRQDDARAFRYDPSSGTLTLLDPLPTEPDSWGQAINSRGDVLGYSFVPGGLERIGVWRGTRFHTYFVEGTDELPTISNRLMWNARGLIVITRTNDLNSYLVPRPGVRLNLADLTEGPLPTWTVIVDVNNRGDLIGVGGESPPHISSFFLLRRGAGDGDDAEQELE